MNKQRYKMEELQKLSFQPSLIIQRQKITRRGTKKDFGGTGLRMLLYVFISQCYQRQSIWARTFKYLWGPGIDSKEWIPPAYVAWARICKRLWSPGIDSEESTPPSCVAWRAGTPNRVLVQARQAGNAISGLHKRSTDTGSGGPVR
jgi:hypothetical protein